MKKEECINKIIEVTTGLIQGSSGNINEITIRMIAEQAGIGVGLINYHFGSKEQLIEQCVQKMISKVIMSFRPQTVQELDPVSHLKLTAKLVADFLMDNPAVSRISILGDQKNPKIRDNTMKTILGFSQSLTNSALSEEKKRLLLFGLTSILQAAFLRKDISKECLGYDFNCKEERDRYLEDMVDILFCLH
jgi:Transcriptional regulator